MVAVECSFCVLGRAGCRAVGSRSGAGRRGVASDRVPVVERPSEGVAIAGSGFQCAPCRGLLSLREREEIGFQLAQGHGVRRIAAFLGRAPSTISREVTRNPVSDRYSPSLAQEQTWARARRPKPRKLDGLALREQDTTMLTDRFSPEQVAGRLKVEHPENPEMQLSHETIYQAL